MLAGEHDELGAAVAAWVACVASCLMIFQSRRNNKSEEQDACSGRKGSLTWACIPATAEPEVRAHTLAVEDEFMVVACDGLWDILSSQRCIEIARQHLRDHNDPQTCAQHLVRCKVSTAGLHDMRGLQGSSGTCFLD